MKFIRNYWQYCTFSFCWTYILYGFWGHEQLSTIQIILMYSLVALAIHQFEEMFSRWCTVSY